MYDLYYYCLELIYDCLFYMLYFYTRFLFPTPVSAQKRFTSCEMADLHFKCRFPNEYIYKRHEDEKLIR